LEYISPAGHEAAVVPVDNDLGSIVILPFRWATVDAYYYMETFSKLRKIKGDAEEPQTEESLTQKVIAQVDGATREVVICPFCSTLF
jgi:ABC-type long-subunit fatty acid transport system fused permease/ATPase subunit